MNYSEGSAIDNLLSPELMLENIRLGTVPVVEERQMEQWRFCVLGLPLFMFVVAGSAFALDAMDSMRCSSKLVMLGETKTEVISKCGEPTLREKVTRSTAVKKSSKKSGQKSTGKSGGGGTKTEERSRADEQWTYDLGPRDFIYTLTFEGVELKSIGRGGRGTRR